MIREVSIEDNPISGLYDVVIINTYFECVTVSFHNTEDAQELSNLLQKSATMKVEG